MSNRELPSCRDLLAEILVVIRDTKPMQGRGQIDEIVFRGLRASWLRDAIERIEAIENEKGNGA